MKITISNRIREASPQLVLAVLQCEVENSETPESLSNEMDIEISRIKELYSIDQINKLPEIAATRKAYKLLGKDPNRYRPSAEALCRRIVRGIPVYKVSTLVDIINLVSIQSGFSIGGFDKNKITGNIELGVGTSIDEFEAIGRGILNVEGLPLYRDEKGGIGTPTSDNERTKISENTTDILLIINGFSGNKNNLTHSVNRTIQLLQKYAGLKNCNIGWIE